MPDSRPSENDFLSQLTSIVEENISNEQFGVSELAAEMNMSRSNLLRKVRKHTELSVSQLISQTRLKRGMDLLQTNSFNVSEVSHQVGFGGTSYFIKCFREHYGYPPGEVGKRDLVEKEVNTSDVSEVNSVLPVQSARKQKRFMLLAFVFIVTLATGLFMYFRAPSSASLPLEKSIAVLPFKNDSNDSTNLYLINGLMESTLNNLQKINDLKVISRTSVEKYRNTSRSIPEMAKDLHVNYFVEGSGQKIDDHILLNIQLIEASSDKHLWAKQYRREAGDIFELQKEIAKNIAEEIEAVITPEEKKRIEKNPTEDLVAYDLFLKGSDLFYKGKGKPEELQEAHAYFKKAVAHDGKFALAYANAAIVCYYLDIFQTEKKYAAQINSYADKALLYDSRLAESLVAKALFYMQNKEYELAVAYFEKAIEYNPNSALVLHFLSELYNIHTPNTGKYLEYALKKIKLDIASGDSATMSYNYVQLSNAFLQTGFFEEARKNIDKSLAYDPQNPFGYVKVFIGYAQTRNLKQTKALLLKELNKDTTRFDVLLQIGSICYVMRDYESAYKYYKRFIDIREARQLDVFTNENLKIAVVLSTMGHKEKSAKLVQSFKDFADADRTIYKHLHLAMYHSYQNNVEKTMEHLKLFSKEDNYQFWVLLLETEPLIDPIKNLPEFKVVMRGIETKFWNTHEKIRARLEAKGLL